MRRIALVVLALLITVPSAYGIDTSKRRNSNVQGIAGFDSRRNTWTILEAERYKGESSLKFVPGHHHQDHVALQTGNVAADKMFMLVDLSDTTNWPHSATTSLAIEHIHVTISCDNAYTGVVSIGFLSGVTATNGDFNHLVDWNFVLKNDTFLKDNVTFGVGGQIHNDTDHLFGPVEADSLLLQTDVDLFGPDGATDYPSGNGDIVLFCDVPAGNVNVTVSMCYHTD